jgi:hypothetical protein
MKTIRFKGTEYLFGGESLEESGFIAKQEDYENGICSYAHYFPEQGVMRFQEQIGTREDIEIVSDAMVDVKDPLDSILNVLTHPSWTRR